MTAASAVRAVIASLTAHVTQLDIGALILNALLSSLAIAAAVAASGLVRRIVNRGVRKLPGPPDAERHVRLRRIARFARAVADLALAFAALLAVAAIWGASAWLFVGPGAWLLALLGRFALALVVTFSAMEAVSLAIHYLMARLIRDAEEPRRAAQLATLSPVLRGIAQAAMLIIGGLTLLSEAGVRIGPLLAGAGVAGIAIGFGAQSLVKDVLTGVFLIAEDIVSVGDVVQIGPSSGVVEQMTLRTIRLRGLDGALHIFPYGEAQVVHNMTKTFAYAVFDLQIAYDANVDQAFELIGQTGKELSEDPAFGSKILEPIEVLGLDSLGDSGVVLKARIKTRPIEQWTVGREFNRRIKTAFEKAGIEIPFPHIRLVLPGGAPPSTP